MIILLFLLPLTDSIIPEDPAIGTFNSTFHAGFLIENRFQIRDLSGGYLGLWGKGLCLSAHGFGLGPLKIYSIRANHSTEIIKNLAIGYGASAHIYQFDDGNGHAAYGVDLSIAYFDQFISARMTGLDLNRPRLTAFDQIDPKFTFALSIGQNPAIQFELSHEGFTYLYTGFSIPLSSVISVTSGFKNTPREFFFGFDLNLKPRFIYSGTVHESLGLSHQIGVRL